MPSSEGFKGAPASKVVFILTAVCSSLAILSRTVTLWAPLSMETMRGFQLWRLVSSTFVFGSIGELIVGKPGPTVLCRPPPSRVQEGGESFSWGIVEPPAQRVVVPDSWVGDLSEPEAWAGVWNGGDDEWSVFDDSCGRLPPPPLSNLSSLAPFHAGAFLLYNFRIIERMLGSSKFAAFLGASAGLASVLAVLAPVPLAPGPYSLLGAFFVYFVLDRPPITHFSIGGMALSDKVSYPPAHDDAPIRRSHQW